MLCLTENLCIHSIDYRRHNGLPQPKTEFPLFFFTLKSSTLAQSVRLPTFIWGSGLTVSNFGQVIKRIGILCDYLQCLPRMPQFYRIIGPERPLPHTSQFIIY